MEELRSNTMKNLRDLRIDTSVSRGNENEQQSSNNGGSPGKNAFKPPPYVRTGSATSISSVGSSSSKRKTGPKPPLASPPRFGSDRMVTLRRNRSRTGSSLSMSSPTTPTRGPSISQDQEESPPDKDSSSMSLRMLTGLGNRQENLSDEGISGIFEEGAVMLDSLDISGTPPPPRVGSPSKFASPQFPSPGRARLLFRSSPSIGRTSPLTMKATSNQRSTSSKPSTPVKLKSRSPSTSRCNSPGRLSSRSPSANRGRLSNNGLNLKMISASARGSGFGPGGIEKEEDFIIRAGSSPANLTGPRSRTNSNASDLLPEEDPELIMRILTLKTLFSGAAKVQKERALSIAKSWAHAAGLFAARGDHFQAATCERYNIRLLLSALRPNHPQIGSAIGRFASHKLAIGDYKSAYKHYSRARCILRLEAAGGSPDATAGVPDGEAGGAKNSREGTGKNPLGGGRWLAAGAAAGIEVAAGAAAYFAGDLQAALDAYSDTALAGHVGPAALTANLGALFVATAQLGAADRSLQLALDHLHKGPEAGAAAAGGRAGGGGGGAGCAEARDPELEGAVLLNMAEVLLRYGKTEDALATLHRARAAFERAFGPEHLAVATALNNLGAAQLGRGGAAHLAEAEEHLVAAYEMRRRLLTPAAPPTTPAPSSGAATGAAAPSRGASKPATPRRESAASAAAGGGPGGVLTPRGGGEEAAAAGGALGGGGGGGRRGPPRPRAHPDLANSYANLAVLRKRLRDYVGAAEYCRKAADMRKKLLGGRHPALGTTYNNLAVLCRRVGDRANALRFYRKALGIKTQAFGEHHIALADIHGNLGALERLLGHRAEAVHHLQEALRLRQRHGGRRCVAAAAAQRAVARALREQGQQAEAIALLEEALGILGEAPPTEANRMQSAATLSELGAALYVEGDCEQAARRFKESMDIRVKYTSPYSAEAATTCMNMGFALTKGKFFGQAEQAFKNAAQVRAMILGKEHPGTVNAELQLAAVRTALAEQNQRRSHKKKKAAVDGSAETNEEGDRSRSTSSLSVSRCAPM